MGFSDMRASLQWLLVSTLALTPAFAFAAPGRHLDPDLSSLSSLPMHRTAGVVVGKARNQVSSKSAPVQFAVATPLSIGLADGLWDQAEAGVDRWRARVSSSGAVGLGLEFSKFSLPEGASLWVYDEAGQLVQGPYTNADQNAEGKLWTAIVPGASAVLELQVPSESRDAVQLQVAQVDHAFLDISKAAAITTAKSGSCNIDMACSDGNNWRDEGRAVAMISIGNTYVCTGQLLNNARQDKDPLFITANHCQIGQTSNTPASSVVFYWNYQTSTCGGTPNGSLSQNQSGSTLVAADVGSDFSLLRLNKQPNADYKVYFAGWDAGSAIPQSGVAIHHPQGEEKRISTFSTAAVRQNVCLDGAGSGGSSSCTRLVKSWQLNWSRGITESGSSGSGLWNQNHKLVGVLSGGDTSCSNTSGNDYFARLEAAFTANSAANGQLKAWLDPDGSGITSLAGRDSSSTIVVAVADTLNVVGNSVSNLLNVLSNDSSSAGTLTITSATNSVHGGTVEIVDNALRYTPAKGFVGTDSFTYTVTDGVSSAVVPVTVVVADATSGGGSTGGSTGGTDTGSSGGGGGAMQWPLLLVLTALAMTRLLRRRRAAIAAAT
jgi:lysyl endopeptidase